MESKTNFVKAMDAKIDTLDELVAANRQVNADTAARLRLVDELRRADVLLNATVPNQSRELGNRSFRAEVACALHVSERAAENLIGVAAVLSESLIATFAAFDSGAFSYRHVEILVDHAAGLSPELMVELETKVLPRATTLTPPRFDDLVRRTRDALDPQSIDARQEAAFEKRTVSSEPGRDGMDYLTLHVGATHSQAIMDRLKKAALSIKRNGDPRTLAQIRADLAVTVLLHSNGAIEGDLPELDDPESIVTWFHTIVPRVIVTVPVLSLLGEASGVAELDGHGPISMKDARILAAKAPSFLRILTNPVAGTVLAIDRARYKVPKDLRQWLRTRDGTCRFPGCGRLAKYCDVDHTHEWQHGGQTNHDNLAHLCRSHHMVKGETEWAVAQAPDGSGTLTWTSPTGSNYVTHPANQITVDPA